MADPLAELLRSPLDDLPPPLLSRVEALVIAAALLVGFSAGWVVGTPDAVAETTTTTTTAPEPLDMPAGFADTGLGYAVGASWMFTRGPDLVVGITIAHRAGEDPVDVGATDLGADRRGVGIWTVELSGGQRVEHTREFFDSTAPGVITLEFDGLGATVDDVVGLSVRPAVGSGTRVQQVVLPLDGLPARFTSIEPLAVTERVESGSTGTTRTDLTWLHIDELVVDWSNAAVTWSMDQAPDVRVMVQTRVALEGDVADEIVLLSLSGSGAFLQRELPPVSPATSGVTVLRKAGGATRETYSPDTAAVELTLSWLRYGDTSIAVPLDGATRLAPIE